MLKIIVDYKSSGRVHSFRFNFKLGTFRVCRGDICFKFYDSPAKPHSRRGAVKRDKPTRNKQSGLLLISNFSFHLIAIFVISEHKKNKLKSSFRFIDVFCGLRCVWRLRHKHLESTL